MSQLINRRKALKNRIAGLGRAGSSLSAWQGCQPPHDVQKKKPTRVIVGRWFHGFLGEDLQPWYR
ncbi:MAG: hypothetical protein JWO80_2039 [Bryobacterales bacterium]|nr:hypothetical protein [Bryobacterales bacterium]